MINFEVKDESLLIMRFWKAPKSAFSSLALAREEGILLV